MAVYGRRFAYALLMFNIFTGVCHAASASGYCPWRTCGDSVEVRYPFRLNDDALSNRCYTLYASLSFQCLEATLYLNFTGNSSYSADIYQVTKIDYWNQTLSLLPVAPNATCQPFDANRFGGLNLTNTTTLLLDCANEIPGRCSRLSESNFSSVCSSSNGNIKDRWGCLMTLDNYRDIAYNSCYLMDHDPYVYYQISTLGSTSGSATLELQFGGNRTLSLNDTLMPPPPPPPPPAYIFEAGGSKRKRLYMILGVVCGSLAATIFFLLCMLGWCGWLPCSPSRKTGSFRRKNIEALGKLHVKNHQATTFYTLKELQKATKNFSDDCKIGTGGFGTVYKATLDSGVEVAIKRTNRTDMKGISGQFANEVTLLSQVNHRNLVRLLGCCLEVEVPMLVYEYVSNGDLFQHLQGERCPGMQLSWEKRLQIAIDTAEALRYLHSAAYPPIYHRDMKTSNILLDDRFNVKVADFGISKLVKPDATHVSTAVQGTLGYLDPEYFRTFQLTDKSDVYSFGMVLLELVTSLKPVDFERGGEDVNLMAMALPFIREGNVKAIADARLFDDCSYECGDVLVDQMQRVAELASRCLADSRHRRPTMKEVEAELVAIRGFGGQDLSGMSDMHSGELEMVLSVLDV